MVGIGCSETSAGRHIGSGEDRYLSAAEALHHLVTLGLLHIAVEPFGGDAALGEKRRDIVHHALGVAENQGQAALFCFH